MSETFRQRAYIDALRILHFKEGHGIDCVECQILAKLDSQEDENATLRTALAEIAAGLRKYGEHLDTCEVVVCGYNKEHHVDHEELCPCDCGLDALLTHSAAIRGAK